MSSEAIENPLAVRQAAVLDAALARVPSEGWTSQMLAGAGGDAGEDAGSRAILFPDGIADLLTLYSDRLDAVMRAALERGDLSTLRVRERIKLGVRARIDAVAPDLEAGRRAAALFLLPGFAPLGLKLAFRTVDVLWRTIGDRSTDFNFYTKRALAIGVYLTTQAVWFRDESPGKAESWRVLDRRIDEVMMIEGAKLQLRKLGAMLPSPWGVLGALRYPDRGPPGASDPSSSSSAGRPFNG